MSKHYPPSTTPMAGLYFSTSTPGVGRWYRTFVGGMAKESGMEAMSVDGELRIDRMDGV